MTRYLNSFKHNLSKQSSAIKKTKGFSLSSEIILLLSIFKAIQ